LKSLNLEIETDMKKLLLSVLCCFMALSPLCAQPAGGEHVRGDCAFLHPPAQGTFQQFNPGHSAATYLTLTDARDSKDYAVVKIGRHWIMAQNLNYQAGLTWQIYSDQPTQRYGNGNTDLIGHFWCPGGFGGGANAASFESCNTWGALYAWETAMMADGLWSGDEHLTMRWTESEYSTDTSVGNTNNAGRGAGGHGICPQGWHVPTDAEWGEVFNTLESDAPVHNTEYSYNGKTAGYRAKAPCSCPHSYGNLCVNDKSVGWYDLAVPAVAPPPTLQLIPAGYRSFDGHSFEGRGLKATLWSSSAYARGTAWYRRVRHDSGYVYRFVVSRSYGASVRCIKN
jgi:uncharacterized protein (TIGR02145 family)